MNRRHDRLSFANVVSVIALFVALGGTTLAAIHLGNNSVGSRQLKKNAVTSTKIKKEAVTAAKVKKGTLTGTQINSSTLGVVPNATHSNESAQADVAANGARSIAFREPGGDPAPSTPPFTPAAHQAFALGSMTLMASCIERGPSELELYATVGSSAPATLMGHYVRNFSVPEVTEQLLNPTGLGSYAIGDVRGANQQESGEWIYHTASETITLSLYLLPGRTTPLECEVVGTVVRVAS